MTRRGRFLAPLLALLSCQVGCARCQRSSPDGSRTPADTIIVGLLDPVRSFDPRFAASPVERQVMPLVHCSLFQTNADGTLVPELAAAPAEWSRTATLSVTLRQSVSFSDGTPLTSRDVKATYEGIVAEDRARLPFLDKIEAPTPDRILFHLSRRDETFLRRLTTGIIPATAATSAPSEKPLVSCGPYTLATKDIDGFLLRANPHYGHSGQARTNRLRFVIIPDEGKRLTRLRRGRLDLIPEIRERALVKDVVTKYPTLITQRRAGLATTYLGLDLQDSALRHRTVRQAIAHAIDRRPVVDYVFGGFATPVRLVLGIQYDPTRARHLLDQAGFKQNGERVRLSLTLRTSTDVIRIQEAKALATQLEKIGIQVGVEASDETPPRSKERAQLWLTSSQEAPMGPMATADLAFIGLWRQDVVAVHSESLKGFAVRPDGNLSSLAVAYKM